MRSVVFTHMIPHSQEGTYGRVPFSVPDGVRSVTVRYSYPGGPTRGKPPVNVIDLGLENESGQFLGWSGSSRSHITVGEFSSTPGYRMTPIRPGTWHILTGAYHVQPDGVPVRYEIQFEPSAPVWLFGDLHVHSDASDGQHDIPTLAKKAKKLGLDFLAVTNHNNYSENFSLPRVPGLTLIPGVEWTHYRGHMNFLGVRQPFAGSFIANDLEQMRRLTGEARDNGALISVNHPKCRICPYLWEDDQSFQLVEIWNGPMRRVNMDGIRWWTQLLSQGRRLSAVGGSDYHRDHSVVRLGSPVTAVLADSPGTGDILSAVRQGRSYITAGVRGVRLGLECQGQTFGGVIPDSGSHLLQVRAERMPPGSHLLVVDQRGALTRLTPSGRGVNEEVTVTGARFAYLMAILPLPGGGEYPLAISNPIYFS